MRRAPIEVVQVDADAAILRHVTDRACSPLVSFTSSGEIARRYALQGGARREGLLLSTTVTLTQCSTLMVPDTIGSSVYADSTGNYWFDLSRYRSASIEGLLGTRGWRAFRTSAMRDREWLLLGTLAPNALSLKRVRRPVLSDWLSSLRP
jgi:hypothetical protein